MLDKHSLLTYNIYYANCDVYHTLGFAPAESVLNGNFAINDVIDSGASNKGGRPVATREDREMKFSYFRSPRPVAADMLFHVSVAAVGIKASLRV